jgi:hypothetical protein
LQTEKTANGANTTDERCARRRCCCKNTAHPPRAPGQLPELAPASRQHLVSSCLKAY